MTLLEMSSAYEDSAALLLLRITQLKEELHRQTDPELSRALHRRILALDPLLREMRTLAELTAHYYDRSYHHHENYTL